MNKGDPQEHKFAKLKEKRNSENSSAPKTKPEWEETQREKGERGEDNGDLAPRPESF